MSLPHAVEVRSTSVRKSFTFSALLRSSATKLMEQETEREREREWKRWRKNNKCVSNCIHNRIIIIIREAKTVVFFFLPCVYKIKSLPNRIVECERRGSGCDSATITLERTNDDFEWVVDFATVPNVLLTFRLFWYLIKRRKFPKCDKR